MIQGILQALVSAFTTLGDAILGFLKSGFDTIMLDTTGSTPVLSNLGTFCFVMLSISLTVGYLMALLIRNNQANIPLIHGTSHVDNHEPSQFWKVQRLVILT